MGRRGTNCHRSAKVTARSEHKPRLFLKDFRALVKKYAPYLGLGHWTFVHSWDIRDPGNAAEVDVDYLQEIAYFYWNTHSPELRTEWSREQVVLHELCHCITRHLRAVFMDMAIRHVEDEILRCEIIQRFNDQEEALVGRLSHILYDFLERGESVGPGSLPSESPKKVNKK